LSVSIGYSSLTTSLNITGLVTKVRQKADIRITDLQMSEVSNEGQSKYQEYNKENISVGVNLPNSNSSVTYKVEVTNIGNVEMGILSIEGLPENLEYELKDYQLKEKICDTSNVCKLGIKKEFYITIKYKENGYNTSITEYNINLDFTFKQVYNVTYEGITNNNYPSSILEGETLEVEFTETIPKVVPYINDTKVEYTYENNKLTVENVTGDINLKYIEKVYLTTLSEGTYFKESAYISKIKTVSFVDSVDIPSDALATYNLEENSGDEIKGWIDTNYNLYIGSEWDIYSKDLSYAFQNMSGVTNITFKNLNTSEATTMRNMFYGMSGLTSLDVSTINTTKVKSMQRMFQDVSKLTSLDLSNFDTTNVTAMYGMFSGMSGLTSLDLSNFNTSNVTDMNAMFNGMSGLTTLNLSSFNTSKVISMAHMFNRMSSVTSLDLSGFNTSKVKSMTTMFNGMSSLESLDLSSFVTTNVTDMSYMFTDITALTSLDISNFNTTKVTSMAHMFNGMSSLASLDLSNFDTTNVTDMNAMFYGMSSLTSLDLSNFDTSNVTNMNSMFYKMYLLTTLDFRNATFANITNYEYMFTGIPTNIQIITLNDTTRTWLQDKLGVGKGTIKTVAELGTQ
ncbi:MAG: BspA family leucine-rich repeat surface protein, partial [Bacilli bacterium]|nr:BspA family leucine-rich repeat surface protein [Bacilli bacterium]